MPKDAVESVVPEFLTAKTEYIFQGDDIPFTVEITGTARDTEKAANAISEAYTSKPEEPVTKKTKKGKTETWE